MKSKILLLGIILLGLNSCKDAIPEVELQQFMYISLMGAKNNPNVKELDLAGTGDTAFIISAAYGGTTNYNKGSIEATVEPDMALVEAYNTKHSTEYIALPEGAYSLDKTTISIPNGKNSSEPLKLNIKVGNINLSNEYLMPVTIKSVTGNIPLNDDLKTIYMVFKANVDKEIEKDKWLSAGASSVWQEGFEVEKTFDDDPNTFWHSTASGSMPQWFIVNMAGYKKVEGFTLNNRKDIDQKATPKHIKFETSLDNVTWQTALEVNELSQSRVRQVLPLAKPVIAKYFRVTVLSNWDNAPYTYLAEVSPYSGEAPAQEIDFEVATWKVTDKSTEWNTHAANIIDGNKNEFWHTDPASSMPQWVIIDMQKARKLSGFKLWHRQSPNAGDHGAEPKNIVFELSDDKTTWKPFINVAELSNVWQDEIDVKAESAQTAKYLKLTIKTNWNGSPYTYLAEIIPY